MGTRHNKVRPGIGSQPTAGAHPHVYAAPDVPRFKHRQKYQAPRYAWLLAVTWLATFIGTVLHLLKAVTGADPNLWDMHALGDAVVTFCLFCTTCLLWNSWEREERFPELLPRAEYERRYPPTKAAPPAPSRPPNEDLPIHRRVPYVEDVTQTGSVVKPGEDRCG